jgi:AraC-like DNA-binding protein
VIDRSLPVVLAFVTDGEWQTHVEQSLRNRAHLTCLVTTPGIESVIGDVVPDIVIVQLDALTMTAADVSKQSARIRSRFPHAILLAYCRIGASVASLLALSARSGIDHVLVRGYDNLAMRVDHAVRTAGTDGIVDAVVERLKPLPARAQEIAIQCMRLTFVTPITVEGLARDLQIHRRTLVYQLRTAGFPPPAGLIGWCRLLVSAHLLDHTDRSVGEIARVLHFMSPSHYRGTLVRYTGLTPTALRQRGALGTVISSFARARALRRPVVPPCMEHDACA